MSLPEFYSPEMAAHQLPPHAEAAIGATALEHRAQILNDIIPRMFTALQRYDCSLRFCIFDFEAGQNARRELAGTFLELDRADYLMARSAFVRGEA